MNSKLSVNKDENASNSDRRALEYAINVMNEIGTPEVKRIIARLHFDQDEALNYLGKVPEMLSFLLCNTKKT